MKKILKEETSSMIIVEGGVFSKLCDQSDQENKVPNNKFFGFSTLSNNLSSNNHNRMNEPPDSLLNDTETSNTSSSYIFSSSEKAFSDSSLPFFEARSLGVQWNLTSPQKDVVGTITDCSHCQNPVNQQADVYNQRFALLFPSFEANVTTVGESCKAGLLSEACNASNMSCNSTDCDNERCRDFSLYNGVNGKALNEPEVPMSLRWTIVFIGFLNIFVDTAVSTSVVPILPKELGLDEFHESIVLAVGAVTAGMFGPLCGWLSDECGWEWTLIWFYPLVTGSAILMMSARKSFWKFVIARLIAGIGSGFMYPSNLSLVVATHAPSLRSSAVGFTLAGDVGSLAGPLIGGYLYDMGGSTLLFSALIAVCVFSTFSFFVILPTAMKNSKGKSDAFNIKNRDAISPSQIVCLANAPDSVRVCSPFACRVPSLQRHLYAVSQSDSVVRKQPLRSHRPSHDVFHHSNQRKPSSSASTRDGESDLTSATGSRSSQSSSELLPQAADDGGANEKSNKLSSSMCCLSFPKEQIGADEETCRHEVVSHIADDQPYTLLNSHHKSIIAASTFREHLDEFRVFLSRIFITRCAALLYCWGVALSLQAILPIVWNTQWKLSPSTIGLLFFPHLILRISFSALIPFFSDQTATPLRHLITLGLAICTISVFCLSALGNSRPMMHSIVVGFAGAGIGLADSCVMAWGGSANFETAAAADDDDTTTTEGDNTIMNVKSEAYRGRAFALLALACDCGAFVGPFLTSLIAEYFSFGAAFIILGFFGLSVVCLSFYCGWIEMMLLLPTPPPSIITVVVPTTTTTTTSTTTTTTPLLLNHHHLS